MECKFPTSRKGKDTMRQVLTTTINGVDLTRLTETIAAVRASPELGSFRFRIKNRWYARGANRSDVQPFGAAGKEIKHKAEFMLVADEPDMLLGDDNGAN